MTAKGFGSLRGFVISNGCLAVLLSLMLGACGGGTGLESPEPCEGDECGAGACVYSGQTYRDGTTGIPAADGCNTCSCSSGQVGCTEKACVDPDPDPNPVPPNPCAEGETNGAGDAPAAGVPFNPSNDCNTCSCSNGQLVCTDLACPPRSCVYEGVEYPDGASIMAADGCNTCGCADGDVVCTLIACSPPSCEYEGGLYADGESFPAADGCNTCICSGGGVACTKIGCQADCMLEGCGPDENCVFVDGTCGGAGTCVPAFDACDAVYAPVCGCDGLTYGNACSASGAGASVAYQGECSPVVQTCESNDACSPEQYCHTQVGFCSLAMIAAGASQDPLPPAELRAPSPFPVGLCETRPDACTTEEDPVCGCNGVTYGNPCVAAGAGVSVAYTGVCQ